jgi:hypothetical protein
VLRAPTLILLTFHWVWLCHYNSETLKSSSPTRESNHSTLTLCACQKPVPWANTISIHTFILDLPCLLLVQTWAPSAPGVQVRSS